MTKSVNGDRSAIGAKIKSKRLRLIDLSVMEELFNFLFSKSLKNNLKKSASCWKENVTTFPTFLAFLAKTADKFGVGWRGPFGDMCYF